MLQQSAWSGFAENRAAMTAWQLFRLVSCISRDARTSFNRKRSRPLSSETWFLGPACPVIACAPVSASTHALHADQLSGLWDTHVFDDDDAMGIGTSASDACLVSRVDTKRSHGFHREYDAMLVHRLPCLCP